MNKMSNFFELVSVCAGREDILLQMYDGYIVIYVGEGPHRAYMSAKCADEEKCKEFLKEITTGKYAKEKSRALNDTKAA